MYWLTSNNNLRSLSYINMELKIEFEIKIIHDKINDTNLILIMIYWSTSNNFQQSKHQFHIVMFILLIDI